MWNVLLIGIEFMTPKYRTHVFMYCGVAFHIGQWISFLLTHSLSNWFWITITNTVLVFPYFILLYYVDESPQWLLAHNQAKQLKQVLAKLNQINLARLDDDSLNSIVSVCFISSNACNSIWMHWLSFYYNNLMDYPLTTFLYFSLHHHFLVEIHSFWRFQTERRWETKAKD